MTHVTILFIVTWLPQFSGVEMKRNSLAERYCPIARSAVELVDAWTFVVLREMFLNNRKFDGLQQQTGMSPRSLAIRLGQLVEAGILERRPYCEAPLRNEYHLTAKGLELWPVVIALKQWGDKWVGPWGRSGLPLQLEHKGHAHTLTLQWTCGECGESVSANSATAHMSDKLKHERASLAAQKSSRTRSKG